MASILIVDDSPTETHILQTMLEKHGFSVSTADNGETGIDLAKSSQPDLILMDVVMPGINGFQAARKISNDPATKSIPIIIVSTKDQETDRHWGLRQGASEYVTKPTQEKELIGKIKQLLNE